MRHFLLLVVLAALPCCLLQAAQQAGYVRAADQPIPGATVTASQGAVKLIAVTDTDGRYMLNLAPGTWDIQVEMPGFATTHQQTTIPEQNDTAPPARKDFDLEVSVQGTPAPQGGRGFQSARFIAIQGGTTQDGPAAVASAAARAGERLSAGGDQTQAFLVTGSISGGLGAASDDYALKRMGGVSQLALKPAAVAFEIASIRPLPASGGAACGALTFTPGRVAGTVTAQQIILEAYQLSPRQLSGGPSWLGSDRFCLDARASTPADKDQLRLMLQTLLAERFQLAVQRTTKEMPVYALSVAKNGATLYELKPGDPFPDLKLLKLRDIQGTPAGAWSDRKNMKDFADALSRNPLIDRPVLDRTGLEGEYLILLRWGTDDNFMGAVEEQLGLKFEAETAPMDVVIVDRIEKPPNN